jgi:hypothetical protein
VYCSDDSSMINPQLWAKHQCLLFNL